MQRHHTTAAWCGHEPSVWDTHHRYPVHSSWFHSKGRNNNFGDVFLAPLYIAAICRSIRLMSFSSFHSFRLFSCVSIPRWRSKSILSLPRYLHVMRHQSMQCCTHRLRGREGPDSITKLQEALTGKRLKRMLRMPCRVKAH